MDSWYAGLLVPSPGLATGGQNLPSADLAAIGISHLILKQCFVTILECHFAFLVSLRTEGGEIIINV